MKHTNGPDRFAKPSLWLLASFSWAASFVLIFKGLSLVGPLALVASQAVVGAVVLIAVGLSTAGLEGFKSRAAEAWQAVSYEPVVALVGFYFLQVTRRYTEGQSGANVLFIMGLAPAVVLLLCIRNLSRPRAFVDVLATLVALFGAVAILANWERPSSLSPFAIFPGEEMLLLGAAICWAAFIVMMRRRIESVDTVAAGAVVLAVTAVVLVAAALVKEGPGSFLFNGPSLRLVVMLGAFGAALGCYSWLALVKATRTPVEAASPILVVPALLSLLIFIDQAQGLTGPNPMIERPVLIGSLLTLLGAAGVWSSEWWNEDEAELGAQAEGDKATGAQGGVDEQDGVSPWRIAVDRAKSPLHLGILVAGVGTAVASVTTLALPVQRSVLEGSVNDTTPFAARWTTSGWEAVGAWLTLLAAVIVIGMAWQAIGGKLSGVQFAAGAAAAVALLVAAPQVPDSVFVAWRSWIPADVQHAIGTPYATLEQIRIANPGFAAVDIMTAIALALVIVKILWRKQKAS